MVNEWRGRLGASASRTGPRPGSSQLASNMTVSENQRSHLRIAYVVNNAAFFVSHRLVIALAARQAGHEVMLVTGQAGSQTLEAGALLKLEAVAMPHRSVTFSSAGTNLLKEAIGFFQLLSSLRKFRPDIVHCVSPKGVLYGGLAARLMRSRGLVLAVSGMGYLFTSEFRGWAAALRLGYSQLMKFAFGHPNMRSIVQNHDDWRMLQQGRLARHDQLVLIPGSGVNLKEYEHIEPSARTNLVVLPARVLKDKGVREFAHAARMLRESGCDWRFALVGTADYQNPSAVPLDEVQGWVLAGYLEWWGHRTDMVSVFAEASIVCLPSYREGMPKALLEAAAAGCAVVTTDVIGCREAVLVGETGDLVPARDTAALASTLLALINDPLRLASYSAAGRRLAASRFGVDAVIERTLAVYQELMPRAVE